jgi:hypothetical protein
MIIDKSHKIRAKKAAIFYLYMNDLDAYFRK